MGKYKFNSGVNLTACFKKKLFYFKKSSKKRLGSSIKPNLKIYSNINPFVLLIFSIILDKKQPDNRTG